LQARESSGSNGRAAHAGSPEDQETVESERPLDGINVVACLHVTVETANLIHAMKAGGRKHCSHSLKSFSTQDDVAAALARKA